MRAFSEVILKGVPSATNTEHREAVQERQWLRGRGPRKLQERPSTISTLVHMPLGHTCHWTSRFPYWICVPVPRCHIGSHSLLHSSLSALFQNLLPDLSSSPHPTTISMCFDWCLCSSEQQEDEVIQPRLTTALSSQTHLSPLLEATRTLL